MIARRLPPLAQIGHFALADRQSSAVFMHVNVSRAVRQQAFDLGMIEPFAKILGFANVDGTPILVRRPLGEDVIPRTLEMFRELRERCFNRVNPIFVLSISGFLPPSRGRDVFLRHCAFLCVVVFEIPYCRRTYVNYGPFSEFQPPFDDIISPAMRHFIAVFTLFVAVFMSGEVVAANEVEDTEAIRGLAEHGIPKAQNRFGELHLDGIGVRQDHAEAVKWFRRAAEQGFAPAQYNLGVAHNFGVGVAQDHAKAAKWFRRATEQGHAKAQYNLGMLHLKGAGVPQNDGKAAGLFRRAAEQGLAEAQYSMGLSYEIGSGVRQNHTQAIEWFRRAAEQGSAEAQHNLGAKHLHGSGVSQNHAEAAKWFRRAAMRGLPYSQFNLGILYYNGNGVSQNYRKSYIWFSLAMATWSVEEVGKYQEKAAAQLSPDELSAAQKEAFDLQIEIQLNRESAQ